MWCEVSADVRRLVVASLPFAAMRVARDVDCELRGLVDDDGMRMLARELGCVTDSAQGAAEGALHPHQWLQDPRTLRDQYRQFL